MQFLCALKVTSKNANATVMGYQICLSSACASSEGLRHEASGTVVGQNNTPPKEREWSNAILLGSIEGWKVGDTADIKIQVNLLPIVMAAADGLS
ncbi:hypothetical protein Ngar_c25130 [Candidatus Nitrososphaera gargensis Ga9.2]|uniref:Uncharacterized protein n=1 Tax=Nitrososphaera gargensis (strain Ga9.2) TaxID=1237085 RepID=K0IDF9_NITGG|nr:hypothetical protein Ngar_c25130 [Candidatus Nitrososphaera gargensis Ga9.2]